MKLEDMKLRNSWCIVERLPNDNMIAGTLLWAPDNLYFDNPLCQVLSKGPGRQKRLDLREYMDCEVGDLVVVDGIFTDDRNKLSDGSYYIDCKSIEAIVSYD